MSHQKPGNSPRNYFSQQAIDFIGTRSFFILKGISKSFLVRPSVTYSVATTNFRHQRGEWFLLDILKRWEL